MNEMNEGLEASGTRPHTAARPVWWLLANGLRGLIQPIRALRAVPAHARLPYLRLVPILMVVSVLWALAHYRLVNHLDLLSIPRRGAIYAILTFTVAPLVGWLITGTGFYGVGRLVGRPRTFAWCDVAALPLWMVWITSLGFDVVHLNPAIPVRVVGVWWQGTVLFVMHAGWFYAFPMLLVQLIACWRVITGRRGMTLGGVAFAVGCLGIMRLVLRPLPELITGSLSRWGIGVDTWIVAFHVGWALGLVTLMVRWCLLRGEVPPDSVGGLVGSPGTWAVSP